MSDVRTADASESPAPTSGSNDLQVALPTREPALDGIRALAVGLVILAHVDHASRSVFVIPGLRAIHDGGFIGVNVFFVLSGFLITSLLLDEHARTARIAFGRFFARRSARLLPALACFIALTWALAAASGYREVFTSRQTVAASLWHALTFTSNLQHLGPQGSDGGILMGDWSHLWSLAIEWQFYLVWPFVLVAVLRLSRSLRSATWFVAGLLALAVLNRAIVFHTTGWVAAYHRSDAAVDGLLVGALTAVLFARGLLRASRWIRLAGSVGLAVVIVSAFTLRGGEAWAYDGGILLAELATAAVVAAAFDPAWSPRRVLVSKPAVAIGVVSYGIYLWHFAAFNWVFEVSPTMSPFAALAIGIAATAILVVGSRRFIEQPASRWASRLLARHPAPAPTPYSEARRRFVAWTGTAAVLSTAAYVSVLWNRSLDAMRSDTRAGVFGAFYDLQARSMFHGRFDVPRGRLGIEAFHVGARDYTYFPPFPSIIRMPVLLVSNGFDGRLTAVSMLFAWSVAITFGVMLMWRVRCMTATREPVTRLEAALWSIVVVATFAGSVWLYLASLPWVYHEAFVWGCAGASGALYFVTSLLEQVTARRIIGVGAFVLIAIWSRTTMGWGCALAAFAVGCVLVVTRRASLRHGAAILAASVLPVVAGSAVTYMKFRTLFMHPLAQQEWTRINAQRRAALAANGGGLTGLKYLPDTVATYLNPMGLHLARYYPFAFQPLRPPRITGRAGALFDQTYRTASVIATMPLLCILTGIAVLAVVLPLRANRYRDFAVPLIGASFGVVGVLCYGYISERYLGDFFPLLLIGTAVGSAWIISFVAAQRRPMVRRTLIAVLAVSATWGVFVNLAIAEWTLSTNINRAGLPELIATQRWTAETLGSTRPMHHYAVLPDASRPNDVAVVGRCRAVYFGTGERFEPWIPAALPTVRLTLTPRPQFLKDGPLLIQNHEGTKTTPGRSVRHERYDIATLDEANGIYLQAETNSRGKMRIWIAIKRYRGLDSHGPWRPLIAGPIEVFSNLAQQQMVVMHDGVLVGGVPTGSYDLNAFRRQAYVHHIEHQVDAPFAVQDSVEPVRGLCRRSTG